MRSLRLAAGLGLLLLGASVDGARAEPSEIEDFELSLEDFVPSGETATSRSLVFLSGRTSGTDPRFTDAAIVAVELPGGHERWRAVRVVPGGSESARAVAADLGRVCVGSTPGIDVFSPGFAISCYAAGTGRFLWERTFLAEPGRGFFLFPRLQLIKRALLATFRDNTSLRFRTLVFDAEDGSEGWSN